METLKMTESIFSSLRNNGFLLPGNTKPFVRRYAGPDPDYILIPIIYNSETFTLEVSFVERHIIINGFKEERKKSPIGRGIYWEENTLLKDLNTLLRKIRMESLFVGDGLSKLEYTELFLRKVYSQMLWRNKHISIDKLKNETKKAFGIECDIELEFLLYDVGFFISDKEFQIKKSTEELPLISIEKLLV